MAALVNFDKDYQLLMNSLTATTADLELLQKRLVERYHYTRIDAFIEILKGNVPQRFQHFFAECYGIINELNDYQLFNQSRTNVVKLLEQTDSRILPYLLPSLPEQVQMKLLKGAVENKFTNPMYGKAVFDFCNTKLMNDVIQYRKSINVDTFLRQLPGKFHSIATASKDKDFKRLTHTIRGRKNLMIVVTNEQGHSIGCYLKKLPNLHKNKETEGYVIGLKGLTGVLKKSGRRENAIVTIKKDQINISETFSIQIKNDGYLRLDFLGDFSSTYADPHRFGFDQFGFSSYSAGNCSVQCFEWTK
ncbi:TLDc domain-containing protein [Entamoeba marina]